MMNLSKPNFPHRSRGVATPGRLDLPPRLGIAIATLGVAALIAGCGSSGSSTIAVGSESPAATSLVEKTPVSTTGTTPTSGPLATEPTITPPKGPAPTKLVTKEIVPGTGAEAKAGESVTVNYVGALYSSGKGVQRIVGNERTLHLHARRGPGHQGLGPGRRRHARGGQARADHSLRTGLRRERVAAQDPAELAVDLHRRPAVRIKAGATSRFARLAAAALAAGAAATGAAGCGGHRTRPAALRVERVDLVQLAHVLQQLQAPTVAEVAAARVLWPSLAGGLPRAVAPALHVEVAAVERRAAALTLPAEVTTEGSVTGPAAELAGMLKSYVRLTQRGWQYLATALGAGSGITVTHAKAHAHHAARRAGGNATPAPGRGGGAAVARGAAPAARGAGVSTAAARFLRANAALYIYCVYDGHWDLSLIGKVVQSAYGDLGGPSAFGASLTPSQVEALARAYSIPAARLEPHPAPSVVV